MNPFFAYRQSLLFSYKLSHQHDNGDAINHTYINTEVPIFSTQYGWLIGRKSKFQCHAMMRLYIGMGRQISHRHKRCIREEDCKSNNRLRAKQIIHCGLSLLLCWWTIQLVLLVFELWKGSITNKGYCWWQVPTRSVCFSNAQYLDRENYPMCSNNNHSHPQ